jgi:hypothetical protein
LYIYTVNKKAPKGAFLKTIVCYPIYQLVPSLHAGTVFAPPPVICAPKLLTAAKVLSLTNALAPAIAVRSAKLFGAVTTDLGAVNSPDASKIQLYSKGAELTCDCITVMPAVPITLTLFKSLVYEEVVLMVMYLYHKVNKKAPEGAFLVASKSLAVIS